MQATVLSIAGSDPTGGAGIQADLKTMTSIGVYGAAAVTCITVQNSHGVTCVECLPPGLVYRQIKIVLDDHYVTHVKIGMVGTGATGEAIRDALAGFRGEIIYDPVMLSSTGQPLTADSTTDDLSALLAAQSTVLTPNIPELGRLLNVRVDHHGDVLPAAGLLLDKYRKLRVVLIKGGHAVQDGVIVDTMVDRTADALRSTSAPHPAIQTRNTHGTGCTLASAFASFHCLSGDDLYSFEQSVKYVQTVLRNSASIQIIKNRRGSGGVLHFSFGSENG